MATVLIEFGWHGFGRSVVQMKDDQGGRFVSYGLGFLQVVVLDKAFRRRWFDLCRCIYQHPERAKALTQWSEWAREQRVGQRIAAVRSAHQSERAHTRLRHEAERRLNDANQENYELRNTVKSLSRLLATKEDLHG